MSTAREPSSHSPFALLNARVILEEEVARVSVFVRDGVIHRLDGVPSAPGHSIDCNGDFLLPGLVELHTDNLERHLKPRPGTWWSADRAVLAHDAELAAAGVTTAFDAISLGNDVGDLAEQRSYLEEIAATASARAEGLLRIDHHLHFRCELSSAHLHDHLERAAALTTPRLVSLMDHTPGQGQWTDVERFRRHYGARYDLDTGQLDELVARRQRSRLEHAAANRKSATEFAARYECVVASHDDTTPADVETAHANGCSIAEFPTSLAAAHAARGRGIHVIAGAPNLARGGSHSGNVSAADLARAHACDILSSDYYPPSLLQAAFILSHRFEWPLPRAIGCVTAAPARALGLLDRGVLAEGRRADLVRVRETTRGPVNVAVWCAGRQVA